MPNENPQPPAGPQPQPLPNLQKLLPQGSLSNRHKRWIFFGVMTVVLVILLANVVGTPQSARSKPAQQVQSAQQQQNPTPAQIRDWENSLKQAEGQLQDEMARRQQQLQQMRENGQNSGPTVPLTADDLQRAAALREAAEAHQQFQQTYAAPVTTASQKSPLETEKEQQAYRSLFADSLVRQEHAETAGASQQTQNAPVVGPLLSAAVSNNAEAQVKPAPEKERKRLDFDPAAQQNYWLPEGTVIEAVLTNRLNGDQPGPVNCMITTDVFLPGTALAAPSAGRSSARRSE